MFNFEYNGGVSKPDPHSIEKLMLFFIVNGREVSFYTLLKNHIINTNSKDNSYSTLLEYGKVFLSVSGFGIRKQYASVYFRLTELPCKVINVVPFPIPSIKEPVDKKMYFSAPCSLLSKNSVKSSNILTDVTALEFLERQPLLTVKELKSIVTVDLSAIREKVRKIKLIK